MPETWKLRLCAACRQQPARCSCSVDDRAAHPTPYIVLDVTEAQTHKEAPDA